MESLDRSDIVYNEHIMQLIINVGMSSDNVGPLKGCCFLFVSSFLFGRVVDSPTFISTLENLEELGNFVVVRENLENLEQSEFCQNIPKTNFP